MPKIQFKNIKGNLSFGQTGGTVHHGGLYEPGVLQDRYETLKTEKRLINRDKFGALDFLKMCNILVTALEPKPTLDVFGKPKLDHLGRTVYSACRLFEDLEKLPPSIKVELGVVSKEDVKAIFGFCGKARGTYLRGTQIDKDMCRYGNLTPLILHAFKDHKGIKYEQWDILDSEIERLIGHDLCPRGIKGISYTLVDICRDRLDYFGFDTVDEVASFRSAAYTSKVPNKDEYKYKLSNWPVSIKSKEYPLFDRYPKTVINMMLQGHLANILYRVPDVHILDPYDWDAVPRALDSIGNKDIGNYKLDYTWQLGDDENKFDTDKLEKELF